MRDMCVCVCVSFNCERWKKERKKDRQRVGKRKRVCEYTRNFKKKKIILKMRSNSLEDCKWATYIQKKQTQAHKCSGFISMCICLYSPLVLMAYVVFPLNAFENGVFVLACVRLFCLFHTAFLRSFAGEWILNPYEAIAKIVAAPAALAAATIQRCVIWYEFIMANICTEIVSVIHKIQFSVCHHRENTPGQKTMAKTNFRANFVERTQKHKLWKTY